MKKALIVIAVLALVLIAAFLLSGLAYSGSRYQAEVEIQAPASDVYRWLTEPDKLKRWVGGLVESRPLDERLEPGARSIETIENDGVKIEMETEVLEVAPNQRLVFRLSAAGDFGFEGVSRYRLSEVEGATRVVLEQDIQYQPFLLKAISPLMAGQVQAKLDADFQRLKSLVEAESRPAGEER